jgi:hypothetical protein
MYDLAEHVSPPVKNELDHSCINRYNVLYSGIVRTAFVLNVKWADIVTVSLNSLNGATPLYIQIKNLLQRQIEEGVYAVGDRLPTEAISATYCAAQFWSTILR